MDAKALLYVLLQVILSWGFAHGQTTEMPYQVPPALLPIMCILLAMAVLALCLIGFMLICLSALMPSGNDEESMIEGVDINQSNGKPFAPKHTDYEKDDPFSRQIAQGESLALKVQNTLEYSDSNDVIINMEPYHHDGSELKNSTRSLLQGVRMGSLEHVPASGNPSMSDRYPGNLDCSLCAEEGTSRPLERKVTGAVGMSERGKERLDKQLWRIKVEGDHVYQDTELIMRG